MARGVNKVILVGNLGDNPEVRQISNGNSVANLSIATSESWRDRQNGQMVERTEWHRVVIFGKLAEIAGQYLRKGSKVYIEGKLQTRKWQDKQGQDRYTTEIVVDINGQMQMLDRRDDTPETGTSTSMNNNFQANQSPQYQSSMGSSSFGKQHAQTDSFNQQSNQSMQKPQPTQTPSPAGFDDFDDDIPF